MFSTQASRLKLIRKHLNLSQQKLAEMLDINTSKINNIESEKNDISVEIAKKIRDIFNINFTWILLGEGSMFLSDSPEGNIMRVKVPKGTKLLVEYEE